MTASEDIVSVSGLCKRFGKVEALNGLTLHSRPGIIIPPFLLLPA